MNKIDFIKNLPMVQTNSVRQRSGQMTMRAGINKTLQTSKFDDNTERKSLKKSSSLAHTSKVVKYQTTGIIYLKRVQQEQKKLKDIENEIKQITKQIQDRRNYIATRKRTNDFLTKPKQQNFFITMTTTENKQPSIYRKQLNMNNPAQIKNQISIVNTKIANLKKKINSWINQNKQIQKQIDGYRKEIIMYNSLNQNLQLEFQKKYQQFQKVFGESQQMNNDVISKHMELHRKKINKLHQESKLMKQYDNILKTVEKQMQMQKLKQTTTGKPNFYMTQVNLGQSKLSSARKFSPISPYRKKKFNNITLAQMKNILNNYQIQFQKLKLETGTQNIDQMTKKYVEQYEQNYGLYKFINILNQQVNKQLADQLQLKQRLADIKKESQIQRSKIKQQQIQQKLKELNTTIKKKQQYQKQKQQYLRIIKDLKLTLPLVFQRIGCTLQKYPELKNYNLEKLQQHQYIPVLLILQKRKNELTNFGSNDFQNNNKVIKMNAAQLQQQIQNAKKQYLQFQKTDDKKLKQLQTKYQKFHERDELIKTIEANQKFKKTKKTK